MIQVASFPAVVPKDACKRSVQTKGHARSNARKWEHESLEAFMNFQYDAVPQESKKQRQI